MDRQVVNLKRLNKRLNKIGSIIIASFVILALFYAGPSVYSQQGKEQKKNTKATSQPEHPLPLQLLPKDNAGNVDWVAALQQGLIKPRDSLDPSEPPTPVIDLDIYFKVKGDLPDVVYPHYPHTQWLACNNCHPKIFIMQAGANKITMKKIEEGQFCGRCHGKVAFPLSNCPRCHSKPKK